MIQPYQTKNRRLRKIMQLQKLDLVSGSIREPVGRHFGRDFTSENAHCALTRVNGNNKLEFK